MNKPIDDRSQLTRDRMNGRPFLKRGLSMADVAKFNQGVAKTAVVPKERPKRIRRNAFEL